VRDTKTGKNVPNEHKVNIPNGHKISQLTVKYSQMAIKYNNVSSISGTPKFTQIWIFGLKRNHLATLKRSFVVLISERSSGLNMDVLMPRPNPTTSEFTTATQAL
jgi:hypothetical protein